MGICVFRPARNGYVRADRPDSASPRTSDVLIADGRDDGKEANVSMNCVLGYPELTGSRSFLLLGRLEPEFWIL